MAPVAFERFMKGVKEFGALRVNERVKKLRKDQAEKNKELDSDAENE